MHFYSLFVVIIISQKLRWYLIRIYYLKKLTLLITYRPIGFCFTDYNTSQLMWYLLVCRLHFIQSRACVLMCSTFFFVLGDKCGLTSWENSLWISVGKLVTDLPLKLIMEEKKLILIKILKPCEPMFKSNTNCSPVHQFSSLVRIKEIDVLFE